MNSKHNSHIHVYQKNMFDKYEVYRPSSMYYCKPHFGHLEGEVFEDLTKFNSSITRLYFLPEFVILR